MVGIVLAAGSGQRMGGAKARLVVSGAPLANAHATRLREAGCDAVVMVVRVEDADVVPPGILTAISSAPEPAGSLLVGLKLVSAAGEEIVVVTPIDVVPVRADTIRALARELDREGILAATPTSRGRGGHPVVLRRKVLDQLTPDGSLRDVLSGLGALRVRMETDDPAILTDLDMPDDVIAHTGLPPTFIPK
jgi:CTP:molybdopterin cytidylyltransferase MocA